MTDEIISEKLRITAAALEKNNMKCFVADKKEDVPALVAALLNDGDKICTGGSVSLAQSGVIELLSSGKYDFYNRAGLTGEELQKCFRAAYSADAYLCSANAITENGELYNVDGNGNRVSALTFGPDSVIIVAGYNKIVPDLNSAILRVKTTAAPPNAKRLGLETYCEKTGECMKKCGADGDFADGCTSCGRMCCTYVITGYQRRKYRIKVILVGEELGF